MAPKVKKFIDKKEAYKFAVVHRSQKDSLRNDDSQSEFILRPILEANQPLPTHLNLDPNCVDFTTADDDFEPLPENEYENQEEFEQEVYEEELKPGIQKPQVYSVPFKNRNLVFDYWGISQEDSRRMEHDYDYEKHLRPIGKGYFKASTEPIAAHQLYNNAPVQVDEKDLDEKYGSKTLPSFDANRIREEIVEPEFPVTKDFYKILEKTELADDEDGLDDDFILKAMGGIDNLKIDEAEDYEEDGDYNEDDDYEEDEDEYYEDEDEDYIEAAEVSVKGNQLDKKPVIIDLPKKLSKQQEDLEKQFQSAMAEYDEESEVEESEDGEDVANYEDILDQHISRQNRKAKAATHEDKPFYNVRTTNVKSNLDESDSEDELDSNEHAFVAPVIEDSEAVKLTKDALLKQEEEELTHGIDYEQKFDAELNKMLQPPPRPEFDCMSVISTYSNTENHPSLIVVPNKDKFIKLNPRTGLPMGITFPGAKKPKAPTIIEEEESEDEEEAINKGAARPKNESKEDRKLRKQAMKEEKRINRELKKELKLSFKREEDAQKIMFSEQRKNNPQGFKIQ